MYAIACHATLQGCLAGQLAVANGYVFGIIIVSNGCDIPKYQFD
jgi:hypothetical protein